MTSSKGKQICREEFNVESGSILLTDPCYEVDEWAARSVRAANGRWVGSVVLRGGNRIGSGAVGMLHVRLKKKTKVKMTVEFEGLCVDSGTFGVFDRDGYVPMNRDRELFDEIMAASPAGAIDGGYVTSTGGDGRFTAEVDLDKEGNAIAVTMCFG